MNVLPFAKQELRVVVADRDFMSSDMLSKVLQREAGFNATAVQRSDLMRHVTVNHADLIVIGADAESTSWTAKELADCVLKAHPTTTVSIVVLLDDATVDTVIDAFRSGARGVFARHQSTADFIECVGTVGRGLIWAGRQESDILVSLLKTLPSRRGTIDHRDLQMLTMRENEVVKCAAKGKTNKEIASELRISEHTVKNYLWRAFEKLGVSSRVELLFYLTSRGYSLEGKYTDQEGLSSTIEGTTGQNRNATNAVPLGRTLATEAKTLAEAELSIDDGCIEPAGSGSSDRRDKSIDSRMFRVKTG